MLKGRAGKRKADELCGRMVQYSFFFSFFPSPFCSASLNNLRMIQRGRRVAWIFTGNFVAKLQNRKTGLWFDLALACTVRLRTRLQPPRICLYLDIQSPSFCAYTVNKRYRLFFFRVLFFFLFSHAVTRCNHGQSILGNTKLVYLNGIVGPTVEASDGCC